MSPVILNLPVLASQEIEHQAIVEAAVDVMTLPLPADEALAEAFYGPQRRVMVHGPGIDRMQAEIAEPRARNFELAKVEYPRLRNDLSPDAPKNVAVLKARSTLFRPRIPIGVSSRSEV